MDVQNAIFNYCKKIILKCVLNIHIISSPKVNKDLP